MTEKGAANPAVHNSACRHRPGGHSHRWDSSDPLCA